ncbi:hypothetical protein [Streptomyces sp. ME19-01-6]|uniref:hypothetical protein n=1 Tax=Streptomyces sp. ME19-01-6 TaxID=3028686 RepID=UPI0039F62884
MISTAGRCPLARQPDGHVIKSWDADGRSGPIWPSASGWGQLYAMIQWEAGSYPELRDQYVRDPLGLTSTPNDTTAPPGADPRRAVPAFKLVIHATA